MQKLEWNIFVYQTCVKLNERTIEQKLIQMFAVTTKNARQKTNEPTETEQRKKLLFNNFIWCF